MNWDRPKDLNIYHAALIAAALFILLYYLAAFQQEAVLPPGENFAEATVNLKGQFVYLSADCRTMRMIVSPDQVRSMAEALAGKVGRRPDTHDLMRDIIRGYDIQVLRVEVHSLKNNTYYADLYLKKDDKILKLDSRPSDGIAVAIRTGSPVYVSKRLLEEQGTKRC